MVSISEKIIHTSVHQIKLYKQGLFWVAYEQSAYYIWQKKGYKPIKKWFKSTNQEVVQVGFPIIEELLKSQNLISIEKQDTFVCFDSIDVINKDTFEEWKANVPLIETKQTTASPIVQKRKEIEERIVQFDISNTTPIEALLFINDLKKNNY
jgi:hypothetical protein